MTWRGSVTPLDRTFASLPYLLPLIDAIVQYSRPFFTQFPALAVVLIPLEPVMWVYGLILSLFQFGGASLGGIIIFFALYFFVVRNERIPHFIRFNTMQSIIIGIVLSLFDIVWGFILRPIFPSGLIQETLFNVMFLGTVAAIVYSIAQSVMGRYAEIPTISEAARMQTP